MTWLTALALRLSIPERFAKAAGIVGAVALLIALLALGKCAYDRSVIESHDARQDAATAKADRAADQVAAEQRRDDDARLGNEAIELEKVTTHAQSDVDRRLARHRCLRKQQAARAEHREPPACG